MTEIQNINTYARYKVTEINVPRWLHTTEREWVHFRNLLSSKYLCKVKVQTYFSEVCTLLVLHSFLPEWRVTIKFVPLATEVENKFLVILRQIKIIIHENKQYKNKICNKSLNKYKNNFVAVKLCMFLICLIKNPIIISNVFKKPRLRTAALLHGLWTKKPLTKQTIIQ